ncbi:hypothetical protein Btru_017969, partial [Bulinus truncatus]
RNVAFNQSTNQTSTYNKYSSNLAVDGKRNAAFNDGSCTHTNTGLTQNPIWTVQFKKLFSVNRYVLFNRIGNQDRLSKFQLRSYNTENQPVFEYIDKGPVSGNWRYIVTSNKTDPVQTVTITNNHHEYIQTLCEVEIYGETQFCDLGKYGLDCEKFCNCFNRSETCFVSTGGCPTGCAAGFTGEGCNTSCKLGTYGVDCVFSCSNLCLNGTCDITTGECTIGCIDGYKSKYCNETCDLGTYGSNCKFNCSDNCKIETCSTNNGTCQCNPGFKGDKCEEECEPKRYGDGCQSNCSENCLNETCDNRNGHCKGCVAGREGVYCNNNCSSGKYGINCSQTCSEMCNGTCHPVNGSCGGCKVGFMGDWCETKCKNGTYGDACKSNCSEKCKSSDVDNEDICHHQNGQCLLGCQKGYTGVMCSEAAKQEEESNGSAAIVVPIVIVLFLAVVMLMGIFIWRKKKGKEKKAQSTDASTVKGTTTSVYVSAVENQTELVDSQELVMDAVLPSTNHEEVYYNTAAECVNTSVPLEDLHNYLKSHSRTFFEEQFKKIPAQTDSPTSVGLSKDHKQKNRYKNIISYDHSRVHLSINMEKKHGDYINASFVKSYKKDEKFIASQGPSKIILVDFIRMLWEQKAEKVVMLTNLVEEGKQKCERYWPTENEEEFEEFRIRMTSLEIFADCTIRKLEISMAGAAVHAFTQYHFTSWPDKGVPETPWSLVDFEQRVSFLPTKTPIVVHCSAGVGRTGTYIALHNVMSQAKETGFFDFYTTLIKLRQDRMQLVQTAEQYIFLHKAALVAMLCLDTTVHQNDISQHIQKLQSKHTSDESYFQKEFKAICDACDDNIDETDDEGSGDNASNTYFNSKSVNNKSKNRYSNILPKNKYRPFLHCDTQDLGDYINAVVLPCFSKLNHQYVTQLPLPSTVVDFWRLVTQFKVSLIIAFELNMKDKDSTIGQYLPSHKGVVAQFGQVDVEAVNVNKEDLWEESTLAVTVHKRKKTRLSTSSSHTEEMSVTHLEFNGDINQTEKLLQFISYTRSHKARQAGKIIYTCRNGADLSGLACVLSLLLDRMDHDHHITVPLVVGAVKNVRPQIIPTLDQYKTLYNLLKQYSESEDIYCNVGSSSRQNLITPDDDTNIYANS